MKIVTNTEMKKIEQIAIDEYGIPGIVLMENAGVEIVNQIETVIGKVNNKRICVFAGKGNNGGDGYVIARHLHNQGAKVKVFLLGNRAEILGDAQTNLNIISRMNIDIMEIVNERDWDKVKIAVTFADCLVDALVGTGFSGKMKDEMAKLIEIINNANKNVFAVDVPTGVDANNGQILGAAVKASHTVMLGLPKQGLLLYPGASYAGELSVADIGLPSGIIEDSAIKQNILTANYVNAIMPKRQADCHKGSCGKVAVVGGSKGLTGAAALSATAALRAGAGLVTLGISESLSDIMAVKLTEVMTRALPESSSGILGQAALEAIKELVEENNVLALGPGLGRHEETMEAVREVIKNIEKPMVIDADALYALVGHTDILAKAKCLTILTPHPGEMARLVGVTAEEINEDRIYIAREAAVEWGSIIVLKGARTVVAFPDGEVYINITGNEGMATGGTGDVLTGIIAGFIAQGLSSHMAALAGVYIHGLAGDIVAQTGVIGLTAGDVLKAIPAAILGIKGEV